MKKTIASLFALAIGAFAQTYSPVYNLEYSHYEIHKGSRFISIYSNVLASGASTNFVIATTNSALFRPGTQPQFHLEILVQAASTYDFFVTEAPTITGVGVAVPSYNRNRQSTKTPFANCFIASNVSAGTLIMSGVGGTTAGSGISQSRAEFILKTNTFYNITFTSRAAGNVFSLMFDWYEER